SGVLARQNWDALTPALLRVTTELELARSRLRNFAAILVEWNGGVSNLFSRNDVSRLVERHFTESVDPAHWLSASGAMRWLDLGSGGGRPAHPPAMRRRGDYLTLGGARGA